MKKRILSILLVLCMALSLLPTLAFARETVGQAATEAELTAALADSGNDIVRLTADITITAGLKVRRNVTVDLNGYVLRYDETAEPDSIFRVKTDCALTMTDSRPAATHEDAKLPAGGLITGGRGYRYDSGSGLTYYYYGGGVYVEAGASFELAGGTIYACGVRSGAAYAYGGGIYCTGGSVTIRGGAIRSCYNANGGGVYLWRGINDSSYPSLTMTGGVIAGCSANSGGGICAALGTVQITGGSIENCNAAERGGGLYIGGHADQISLLDAVISGCEANRGGGLYLGQFAELELGENARITGCTATETDDTEAGAVEYGAAVYMDLGDTYTANYPGTFLYANGGRVEGTVYVEPNSRDQRGIKATNAIDHTDGKPTVFTGNVYCEGDIRGGSFYGSVTVLDPYGDMANTSSDNYWKFCSNLSGGSFYGPVYTECHVSGGTYYAGLTLEKNARFSGKPIQTPGKPGPTTNIPDPDGTPVTVTYDYGELGGTYATQIVQAGEAATRPDDPTGTGHTFAGWYRNGQAYDFDTPVTEDMTLTARWTVNSYTVTFTDGGSVLGAQTVPYGGRVTKPAALTRTGHTFGGWYLGEDEYDFTAPVTENLTLTAFWFTDLYTITFDSAGGTPIMSITQDYDAAISAPADPKKIGYVFAGWDQAFPATMPAQDLTLTARWTLCSHMGSAAHPTCTKGAVCTLCGETLPAAGHEYTWQSGGGLYWQQCSICTQETAKNSIPQLTISGADRVCRTQDYTFSFTLPQGCQDPAYGYDFGFLGDGGLEADRKDGVYSAAITTDSYDAATGFRVMVSAQTEDGFAFTVTKDVAIVDGHSGGTATCTDQAVCEICGESYGDLDAGHHGDLRHVPARAATTDAEGNIEYWYCGGCHKYYADAAATRELTRADTVTAKLPTPATPSDPETPPTPSTGDGGAALWITLLLVSGVLAGMAVTRKRKHSKNV